MQSENDTGGSNKKKILIVDDEKAIRETIAEFLEIYGMEPIAVEDGLLGIEEIESKAYDLCIVDLLMPGIDGGEFIRRAKKSNPATKFIVITGRKMAFEKEYLDIKAIPGVVAVVRKPFPLEKLYETIKKELGD